MQLVVLWAPILCCVAWARVAAADAAARGKPNLPDLPPLPSASVATAGAQAEHRSALPPLPDAPATAGGAAAAEEEDTPVLVADAAAAAGTSHGVEAGAAGGGGGGGDGDDIGGGGEAEEEADEEEEDEEEEEEEAGDDAEQGAGKLGEQEEAPEPHIEVPTVAYMAVDSHGGSVMRECHHARSRIARQRLELHFWPIVRRWSFELDESCPLHPSNDMLRPCVL
jgi:hypothetical protein